MSQSRDLPKNPLIRDGVSQRQRQSPALLPESIQVDERDRTDFAVLAYHLSQKVNYYTALDPSLTDSSLANTSLAQSSLTTIDLAAQQNGTVSQRSRSEQPHIDGNWQDFFASSTPVQLALISKTRTQTVKATHTQKVAKFLTQNFSCEALLEVLEFWKTDILAPIQCWYQGLEASAPFRLVIKGLVKTHLKEPLLQLQALERACRKEPPLYDPRFYTQLGETFELNLGTPESLNSLVSQPDELQRAVNTLFQAFFQVYRQIVQQAPQAFQMSLRDRQDHPPHLALYYAFLEILQLARNDLNLVTGKHLDFFYRQVLALPDRPSQPDAAHLLFELAKSQVEYKLPATTRLKAGKDATGIELFYSLQQDVVIQRAKIAKLHGLFLDSKELSTGEKPQHLLGLYASPIANSLDGDGAAFPKEQAVKAWVPFGKPKTQHASLGVAIASDVLLLQEGRRLIELTLSLDGMQDQVPAEKLHEVFAVYLSGKKKWIAANILPAGTAPQMEGEQRTRWDGSTLYLVIELAADVDPVLPYNPQAAIPFDPEVPNLPLTLDRPTPVLRLHLQDQVRVNELSAYHYFRTATLTDITVRTRVPEVRNLIVQNDLAVIDATKPFQPFGPRPKNQATLYIGSQEVLSKRLTELSIEVQLEEPSPDWQGIYLSYDSAHSPDSPYQFRSDFAPGQLKIQSLRQKSWHETSANFQASLFNSSLSLTDELTKLQLTSFAPSEPIEAFTPQTQNSFLQLQLVGDFLHDEYPIVLARQVLAAATNQLVEVEVRENTFETKRKAIQGAFYRLSSDQIIKAVDYYVDLKAEAILPKEPYTPVIRSLSLNYTAQANQADCQLFHLHPFGGFEKWQISSLPPSFLLPQFVHEGELLIGLQDLNPPTALPLLFQLAEETADTRLRRVEEFKPRWWYLNKNQWVALDDRISDDATHGLVASGIINLGLPEAISKTGTTILDPNLHWVKVSVPARSRTVCSVIGVHTQAARVTFTDAGNDPNHLATPLPPGTIAKLENPQPAIKTIEQPYASFGGRVKEQPNHFYTRVSEHLRHKGRAVTIFDYERLVLEKFPEIYKVRCINHGEFADSGDRLYELRPGFVTLAVIPDLSQRRTTNDLEPKVSANLLQTIEEYLTQLSSSWATIKAVNPQYERIQVEFQVKFRSPYDTNFGYYQRELEKAITGFLTPWTVNQSADINFGGKVYRSSILNFIEQQEYVDYIIDFQMNHDGQKNVREAVATTARSILTSVSQDTSQTTHTINEFKPSTAIAPNPKIATGVLGYELLEELELGNEQ